MARIPTTAAALVGLGLLLTGIVLWRQFSKIQFHQVDIERWR